MGKIETKSHQTRHDPYLGKFSKAVSFLQNSQEIISPNKLLKIQNLFQTVNMNFILMRQNVFCQLLFIIYFVGFEIAQFIAPGLNFKICQCVIINKLLIISYY